ncbi:MAG: hypothetical protein Q8Q03_00325, partial [bacterium]|nr:hypothetical protein [bacterium]
GLLMFLAFATNMIAAEEIKPSITVTLLDNGWLPSDVGFWQIGSQQRVSWSSVGLEPSERVWIVIQQRAPNEGGFGGTLSVAQESQPQKGYYSWTIPQRLGEIPGIFLGFDYVAGAQYKIKIGRLLPSSLLDILGESSTFTIIPHTPPILKNNSSMVNPYSQGSDLQWEVSNMVTETRYWIETTTDLKNWERYIFLDSGSHESFKTGVVRMDPKPFQFFRLVQEEESTAPTRSGSTPL